MHPKHERYLISLFDPSGHKRSVTLKPGEEKTLGHGASVDFEVRDFTLPELALKIEIQAEEKSAVVFVQCYESAPAFSVYGILAREARLPIGARLRLGETEIQVNRAEALPTLPAIPSGYAPWISVCESGAKTLWMTKKAAETPLSVYLAGETGSGKEVLAHLIHAWSSRASGAFVPLHCGALSESLAESELFGHVKGAFTGAISHRPGALLQAHNGTLFLDEVGDLSLDLQVKLLRFLENGEIRAVGSDRPTHADVRVICATHLPLLELVEQGKFRRDLYYRLASITIEIPSLRSRSKDIELLATRYAADHGKMISEDALLRLKTYHWPGNVRELKHAVERAVGMAGSLVTILEADSFDFLVNDAISEFHRDESGPILTMNEIQRQMLLKALKRCGGNRADAAKLLGIARSTLFEMLKRYKIKGPRHRELDPLEASA